MKKIKNVLLTSSILLVGISVAAQDTSNKNLDEVIIRQRRKSTEINMLNPIKSEKIGAKELLKAACCNLSESFETTPSVDVAITDAISGYKQIQMLGLAGPYTSITRENIPDARGLSAITGLTFTPGVWIESMQLSKGTGSVVNGYESVAGQINVEWKKPFEDNQEKWYFNLYQSNQGRTEANIVHRKKSNEKLSSNLFVHAKSQWLKQDNNNDGFLDQPLDIQLVLANRWFWFAPKGWEVQGGVKGVYVENTGGQWGYNRGIEQVTGKPWGYQQDIKRIEGWAKIGHVFASKPATSVGLQLSGVVHDQVAQYGNRPYNATQKSFYANFIYQSIIGNTNHVIKAGASTLIDNYDETLSGQRFKRNEVVPGIFAEYAYNHLTNFNVVAGLRADYHNIFGAFVTPRLHVRYSPYRNLSIRASTGRAQRTANIFAENMGYMASNRQFMILTTDAGKAYGLNPEVAWNTGINATQKFRLNYRDGSFSVDYYYTHFQNQIVTDVENANTVMFYNLNGNSFAHSFQAQLDYELIHNLDIRIAYRWYDVKTTYSGVLKERPLIAAHRAFVNIGYETKNKWKFDYTVQWIGQKRLVQTYDQHNATLVSEGKSPSYVLMNAQIAKELNKNVEFYLGGENITNYMQMHPVIGASHPYAQGFDASQVWAPTMGVNVYGGVRVKLY